MGPMSLQIYLDTNCGKREREKQKDKVKFM